MTAPQYDDKDEAEKARLREKYTGIVSADDLERIFLLMGCMGNAPVPESQPLSGATPRTDKAEFDTKPWNGFVLADFARRRGAQMSDTIDTRYFNRTEPTILAADFETYDYCSTTGDWIPWDLCVDNKRTYEPIEDEM